MWSVVGHVDDNLPEVLSFQQSDEGGRRALQSVDDVFAQLHPACADPFTYITPERIEAVGVVVVAVPDGHAGGDERHDWRTVAADLDGYIGSGLPTRSMGREDPLFFAAALAAGTALAEMT